MGPVHQSRISLCCTKSRAIHLIRVLPARRGVSGSDRIEAIFVGVKRSPFHPHVKTVCAPLPTFGIVL